MRSANDQRDTGLEFDGVGSQGLKGSSNGKYAGNQHGGKPGGNYGQPAEARKGASFGKKAGPSTAKESSNPVESGKRKWTPEAGQNFVGNPDKIQDRQVHNRKGNLKD